VQTMFGRTASRALATVMVLAATGAWSMQAQAPASDFDKWWTPQTEALVAAPQHHTLLFENDEVRVLTVTIPPGAREPFHAHRYASVIYDENPSHLVEYMMDGTKVDRGVRTKGGARWLPIGPPHALENVGATPLRIVRVELKKAR
jgi:quercetin dioxygenase-like cupin family protein